MASGQTCIMGARVLVHEDIYDKFMHALVEKVCFTDVSAVDLLYH